MCQWGNPYRVVDPVGVPVSFGAPPAWGAPGRFGTAAAGGPRRVPGGQVIQGCPRYYLRLGLFCAVQLLAIPFLLLQETK